MAAGSLSSQAAIVGIGATEFSKNAGRSEMTLAVECVTAALEDAGIHPSEVDGLVAKDLIRDGQITMGGKLPINTHGGQLGEAYIHGMNGIAEAVRQVRGSAVNQVDQVSNVLVSAGTGVPTSGLILGQ